MAMNVCDPASVGMNPIALDMITENSRRDIANKMYNGSVILVARKEKVCYLHAEGMTDVENGRQANVDDIFLEMSATKCITAVGLMKLIDRGLLAFDTKVADVWPAFGVNGKRDITLHQLMTHQVMLSGDVGLPKPLVDGVDDGDLTKVSDVVAKLRPLNFPGEEVIYQPYVAHAVLGRVIMEVDPQKRSYKQFIEEELFRPLGMKDSSIGCSKAEPRRVPVTVMYGGAVATAGHLHILNTYDESTQIPAGGAYSTASDLFVFAEMLRRGGKYNDVRILSQAICKYALRNHTGDKIFNGAYRDCIDFGLTPWPANYSPAGGYIRGSGLVHLSVCGMLASPNSFAAVGGGSTMMMFDPERELTLIYQSQGFMDGPTHFVRLQRYSDLAIAAVED